MLFYPHFVFPGGKHTSIKALPAGAQVCVKPVIVGLGPGLPPLAPFPLESNFFPLLGIPCLRF